MANDALSKLLREDPALYKALLAQAACERSLYKFTETMWEFVEPANKFKGGWCIGAMSDHLEAISRGDIRKLLINIPPGSMKSMSTSVFFPSWEWIHFPHKRYLCTSYSSSLTERDNIRFRQVITSDLYRAMWGDKFGFSRDSFNVTKIGNDKTGWKIATSTEGVGTGERADVVICDDLHNVAEGESASVRKRTLQYFTEVLPTRMNDPEKSAMVVIMQRVHEDDVSGIILEKDLGFTHLCIPAEFDPARKCYTFTDKGAPLFEDPRTEPGELFFPERFPQHVIDDYKKTLGPYAYSAQFEQSPVPRGGGIIKKDYWKLWPEEGEEFDDDLSPVKKMEYPVMDFIVASVDTAYTSNQENDPNALVILGAWQKHGVPKIMLMQAWEKHLEFRGVPVTRIPDEPEEAFRARSKKQWGMLEWVAYECKRWGVKKLLIEGRSTGITLAQEVQKVYRNEKWDTQIVEPKGDKEMRVHAVQHMWAEGMMYAPDREWATKAIEQCEKFPKGAHDDIVDALTQGVRWLRDNGYAMRRDEVRTEEKFRTQHRGRLEPLYPV